MANTVDYTDIDIEDAAAPWRGLYRYWQDKHVDGRPPSRRDIDPPLEIPHLVKDLMIIDASADRFKYRLIGSAIDQYVRTNDEGKAVWVQVWSSPDIAKTWFALLRSIATSQRPQLVISRFPEGVKAYSHSLVMPLVGADGATENLLIGVFRGGYIEAGIEVEGIETREVVRSNE